MPRDLRQLLDDTAVAPVSLPDTSDLIRRGRRRRRAQRGAGAAGLLVVAALGLFLVPRLTPRPNSVILQPGPTPTAETPAAPEDILGRTFISTAVQRPEGPLLGGTRIVLDLDPRGQVLSWHAGCNSYNGRLQVTEHTLHATTPGGTERTCGKGDEQDDWVSAFLESGPAWTFVGETLTLTRGDQRITFSVFEGERPTPRPTPAPEATERKTQEQQPAQALGPRLDIRRLPRLPREGIAVMVDDTVVLIGMDGTVHGHLPGRFDDEGIYGFQPEHQVPTHLLRVRVDQGPLGIQWLDPHSGRYVNAFQVAAPLWNAEVLFEPGEGPDEGVSVGDQLLRTPGRAVARWPAKHPWFISPDHRLVTWLPCGDGRCDPRFYDSDMGGTGALPRGCRAAHALGDVALTLICDDGRNLVLPQPTGPAPEPIGVPDGADGNASRFMAVYDEGFVRVDTPECRAAETFQIRGDHLRPLGDGGVSAVPLGVLGDGRVVVHHNSDARCGLAAPGPGVYVLDPDTGQRTLLWAGAAALHDVQLWAPTGADLE